MSQQFSMFDLWQPVPVRLPVDPHGTVIQGAPDETLILPHPRMAWPLARIELHRHTDGRWMWSASAAGSSFKVGPKWGRFAGDRDMALRAAALEILNLAEQVTSPDGFCISAAQLLQVKDWAGRLAAHNPVHSVNGKWPRL
ncbi:hypothetical protein [Falsigemmobacter faecalis]|uniref:Uncharacterized protein n=1 Tax=Falsigemmobacter faecalis TaxID=2488730 RepID=A0A3P3DCI7_9RHOB|nr:hypothetical protein [Falsigemmobacter faecalis]RRH72030.1 hypothetical protein EG244_16075 [Falsigemmobacter faecalis]